MRHRTSTELVSIAGRRLMSTHTMCQMVECPRHRVDIVRECGERTLHCDDEQALGLLVRRTVSNDLTLTGL